MNSNITQRAAECNVIPTATTKNNTAPTESIFNENVSSSSGEEETQIHEADKCNAKIHYLSRTITREHGVIPSAILTGFAYKLKHHKLNRWQDRWWYYASIEELRTHRWPYLSDGCLCENIEYLRSKELLIKSCNNKLSFDRTSWYAMDEKLRDEVLSDVVWYDVAVTKQLNNILPGLIYHNLRYHLREMVKIDPQCPVPYHKLNKAMLARLLPMSESSAKRWVKTLVEEGLFIQHPTKRGLYTLTDKSEYRQIGSSTNAIRSSANAIGSSTNGSTANAIGSSPNAIVSKVNAIGSTANDNTQYETNQKPVRHYLEIDACVSAHLCSDAKENPSDDITHHSMLFDDKRISDTVGSVPLREEENTDSEVVSFSSFQMPTTFAQLLHQNRISADLLKSVDEDIRSVLVDNYRGECKYFIEEHLDAKTIQEVWGNTNRDVVMRNVCEQLADYIRADLGGWKQSQLSETTLWQLLYYPTLETLVCAFSDSDTLSKKPVHSISFLHQEVLDANWALICKMQGEKDFSADVKVELFKQAVALHNKYGWTLRDTSRRKNAVQPTSSAFKGLKEIFALNPDITVGQLFRVIDCCVDVRYMDEAPEQGMNDSVWHARRVVDLGKLVAWVEKVINELELFEECPIQNFPVIEKRNAVRATKIG